MQLSPHARGVLALIVTILALTQVAGAALMNAPLLHFGMAIGFAPLPRPFGAVHGYESFATRQSATLTYANGISKTIDLETLVAALHGPHRAKITVLQGFLYMPTYSTAFTAPLLSRVLCDWVSQCIGGERPVRAELFIRSDTAGQEAYSYRRSVSCVML